MDREKVRMIVRHMDDLVRSLRYEIEGPPKHIVIEKDGTITEKNRTIGPYEEDYDEVFGG